MDKEKLRFLLKFYGSQTRCNETVEGAHLDQAIQSILELEGFEPKDAEGQVMETNLIAISENNRLKKEAEQREAEVVGLKKHIKELSEIVDVYHTRYDEDMKDKNKEIAELKQGICSHVKENVLSGECKLCELAVAEKGYPLWVKKYKAVEAERDRYREALIWAFKAGDFDNIAWDREDEKEYKKAKQALENGSGKVEGLK